MLKNIAAAKQLVAEYKEIIECETEVGYHQTQQVAKAKRGDNAIRRTYTHGYMNEKTGFGAMETCKLCVAVGTDCMRCVWWLHKKEVMACLTTDYSQIVDGELSLTALKRVLTKRVQYLETLIERAENETQ